MQKYKMPISRLRMMVCLIGMLLPMCMFAQQITVQGVVKDQTGETVIGASVMEKGTTNGTITGIDGDFSLNMSPNGTLVVSFVGYKTQEVQVKGQKQLQVVLSEDAEMLDEVVVIGYGTMKKATLQEQCPPSVTRISRIPPYPIWDKPSREKSQVCRL